MKKLELKEIIYGSKSVWFRGAGSLAAVLVLLYAAPAMAQRPLGVDVSNLQGSINWSSVAGAGKTFAIAKATEGTSFTDAYLAGNMAQGKAAGLYMGAYHFARPNLNSPSAEAAHFWSVAGPYIKADGQTIMPVLDFEVFSGVVGASSYSDWANQWCNAIVADAAAAGVTVKPILYVSSCNACEFDSSVAQWIPWLADYNGESPSTGNPWNTCTSCEHWGSGGWTLWQYSSVGSVPGISGNTDLDVFNGSLAGLTQTLLVTSASSGLATIDNPTMVTRGDGAVDAFCILAPGGSIAYREKAGTAGSWGGWQYLYGNGFNFIKAIPYGATGVVVFGMGNGAIWYNCLPSDTDSWTGWISIGGSGFTSIAPVYRADGRMALVGCGTSTAVYYIQQQGPTPTSPWPANFTAIPSSSGISQVDALTLPNLGIAVFAMPTSGGAWYNYQPADGAAWNGWANLGGSGFSRISAVMETGGKMAFFGCGSGAGSSIFYQEQSAAGVASSWSGWISLGGSNFSCISGVALPNNGLAVFGCTDNGAGSTVYYCERATGIVSFGAYVNLTCTGARKVTATTDASGLMSAVMRGASGGNLWGAYMTDATHWQTSPLWFNMGGYLQ